jgi:hypothetical protein
MRDENEPKQIAPGCLSLYKNIIILKNSPPQFTSYSFPHILIEFASALL